MEEWLENLTELGIFSSIKEKIHIQFCFYFYAQDRKIGTQNLGFAD